jgi:hypothetical protein
MESKLKSFNSKHDNIISINKTFFIVNRNVDSNYKKVRSLNYKFKRKSKNFFCWLEDVKNIHYSKTEGLIM